MVHGDDRGLVVPPRIAPTQVMIVPIAQHKEGVLDFAYDLKERLGKVARVSIDASDKKPGWKFNEYEMKGIPVRLEVGPKDIENNQVVLARRDSGEKIIVSLDELEVKLPAMLEAIQNDLYNKALNHREENTFSVQTFDAFKAQLEEKQGFIKAMWCGDQACEDKIKEETGATSRCMPFEQERISEVCICCSKPAEKMVVWAKAY
jgi:prolyl-tRNA synthetase